MTTQQELVLVSGSAFHPCSPCDIAHNAGSSAQTRPNKAIVRNEPKFTLDSIQGPSNHRQEPTHAHSPSMKRMQNEANVNIGNLPSPPITSSPHAAARPRQANPKKRSQCEVARAQHASSQGQKMQNEANLASRTTRANRDSTKLYPMPTRLPHPGNKPNPGSFRLSKVPPLWVSEPRLHDTKIGPKHVFESKGHGINHLTMQPHFDKMANSNVQTAPSVLAESVQFDGKTRVFVAFQLRNK